MGCRVVYVGAQLSLSRCLFGKAHCYFLRFGSPNTVYSEAEVLRASLFSKVFSEWRDYQCTGCGGGAIARERRTVWDSSMRAYRLLCVSCWRSRGCPGYAEDFGSDDSDY